jgi:hypothetical protein
MINAETVRQGDAEIIESLLSEQMLDTAIEVHRTLGAPGLLESLYEDAQFYELRLRNIPALSQVPTPYNSLCIALTPRLCVKLQLFRGDICPPLGRP